MTKKTLDYEDTLTVLGAIDALDALCEIIAPPLTPSNLAPADRARQFADDYIRAKKAFDENFDKAAKAQGVNYYVSYNEFDDDAELVVAVLDSSSPNYAFTF